MSRHIRASLLLGKKAGFKLPYSIDFSTLSDGALPALWTGGAGWAIATGKAVNTPPTTIELVTDGGMEIWTDPANLTNYVKSGDILAQETTIIHGGASSARLDASAAAWLNHHKTGQTTQKWVLMSIWAYGTGTAAFNTYWHEDNLTFAPGAAWKNYIANQLTIAATMDFYGQRKAGGAGNYLYLDDLSILRLTTSELVTALDAKKADVTAEADITYSAANGCFPYGGVLMNLDSVTNPQNFVMASITTFAAHPQFVRLWKCVAGTFTQVLGVDTEGGHPYAAGGTLKVVKSGTSYDLYYRDQKLGATQTINNAGIINNTLHGLVSMHSSNHFSRFALS